MNLRSLFALGALVASLAVPGIASAHGMDYGRQGYAVQDQGPARFGRADEGMRGRFDRAVEGMRGRFDRGQDFRRDEPMRGQDHGWGRGRDEGARGGFFGGRR